MKKIYSLSGLLAILITANTYVNAQTNTVFTDNFDRVITSNNNGYGSPVSTYTVTLGSTSTITGGLVSGGNYVCNIASGTAASSSRFIAPINVFNAPFSTVLSSNSGLITWTFNMRTNTNVTSNNPATTQIAGGIVLCNTGSNANILNGAGITGYGVVFNSSATGGVSLIRFSAGMATNVALATQATTIPKTDFYSVRVTYNPTGNLWSLYVRDDGSSAFADPTTGVTTQEGSTVADATYTGSTMVSYGALYTWTAGVGRTMSIDNYSVGLTLAGCSGTPTAGTVSATVSSGCGEYNSVLSVSGATSAGGLTYQWQTSPDNSTWAPIPGATNTSLATVVYATTYYRRQITCGGNTVATSGLQLSVSSPPSVATMPFFESFETAWLSSCNTAERPNNFWADAIVSGNNSWRREDFNGSTYTSAGWSSNNGLTYSPVYAVGSHSARWHSYDASSGTTGALDLYIDMSAVGTKQISYSYANTSGTDNIQLQISTDNGATFIPLDAPPAIATVWTTRTVTTTMGSAKTIIRFRTIGDFGTTDIGLDNINIVLLVACSGTPGPGTVTASQTSGCGPYTSNLALTGTDIVTGLAYQWQFSPDSTSWTTISGATNTTYTTPTISSTTYYRNQVTCTNPGGSTGNTPGLPLKIATTVYAATPFAETFENWIDVCSSHDAPTIFWRNSPATGNTSWRRDDDGASAAWGIPGSYVYTPAGSNAGGASSLHSARYHQGNISGGTQASLSLYINLPAGGSTIVYDYINNSSTTGANSSIQLQVSTDGGGSFTNIGPRRNGPHGWQTVTEVTLISSPTAILRWLGTADFGVNDIGIDNVGVFCAAPAITGSVNECVGATTSLSNPATGGVWSSASTAIATVNSASGAVTGVAGGITTITYVQGGCQATALVTINALPVLSPVASPASVCPNFSTTINVTTTNPGAGLYLVNSIPYAPVTFTPTGTYDVSTTPNTGTNDDGYYNTVIPFDFTFFGVTYPSGSNCFVETNGYVTFGSGYSTTYINTIPNTSFPATISPFGRDMDLRFDAINNITYGTTGVTPNRKFVISFNGVNDYNSGLAGGPKETGQIVIYETSGNIELHITTGQPTQHSLGIQNNLGSQFVVVPGQNVSSTPITNSAWSFTLPVTPFTWSPATLLSTTTGSTVVAGPFTTAATYTVTTTASNGCVGSAAITVSVNPIPTITGLARVCPVTTSTLTSTPGGTWISGSPGIATIGSSSGIVTGVTAGTALITYTAPTGCVNTILVTVNPFPPAITGTLTACPEVSSTLTDDPGGTWSTTAVAFATINSTTGVYTGVSAGFPTITYTAVTGCIATTVVTINPRPTAPTGASTVCPGFTTTFTDPDGAGTWSINNTALATIGSGTGVVTGVTLTGGVPIITFTLSSNRCFNTTTTSVIATPPILGNLSLCSGFGSTLSNSITGGTWISSNTAVATIGSSSGVVTSFTSGTSIITYTFPNTCTVTGILAVTSTPAQFTVTGGGPYCAGGPGSHIGLTGSTPSVTYQAFIGATAMGSPVSGTGFALDLGSFATTGTYTVIANPGTPCATTMTGSVTVSTTPVPNAFTVSGGGSFCEGGIGFHINLSNSNFGINYQLLNGGLPVGSTVAGTNLPLDFGLQTVTGTYTILAINATTGCTANMTSSAAITANPLPDAYSVTGGGGFCTGSAGVPVGLSNSANGVNYLLYRDGSYTGIFATGTTGSPINYGIMTTGGIYTIQANNATTGCSKTMTGSVTVTVNPLPVSYTLSGGGNYCTSGTGSTGLPLNLSGSTSGINYQLYNGVTPVGIGVPGTNLPLSFGLQTGRGTYTVRATNGATGCTALMAGSPVIDTLPLPTAYAVTGGGSFCIGDPGTSIGLLNSDPGISYQLLTGTSPVGTAILSTGGALNFGTFTTPGLYTVKATNPGTGCTRTMNGFAVVNANAPPTAYNMTGGGGYCLGGTGVLVGLNGSKTGVKYQLFNGATSIGTPVFGAGVAVSFGVQTLAGAYTVVATDTFTGCNRNMTGSATVVINPLPTRYTITGGGGYCVGGTGVHVGLSASDPGISYQLMVGTGYASPAVAGTGAALDFGLQTAAGAYTVVATNATTLCTNIMTGTVSVNINTLPAQNTVTGGGAVCAGGTGVAVGLNGSLISLSYQLYRGATAIGSPVTGPGGTFNFGLQTLPGTYTVVATDPSTTCSVNMAGSAIVVLSPAPNVYSTSGGGGVCLTGPGVNINLDNSTIGINYQLWNAGPVGSIVAGTGSALTFGPVSTAGTYTILATNPVTTCTGMMLGSATVTTNTPPLPFIVSGGGPYCAGSPSPWTITLLGSSPTATYQLYNGATAVGGALPGTGGVLNFGIQSAPGTYKVIATNPTTGCTRLMVGTAIIVVNSLPATYPVTGGGVICLGDSGVHVGLGNSASGVTYSLLRNGLPTAISVPGTGLPLDFGLQAAAGAYTVSAQDGTTGCTATMSGSVTVTVNMPPTAYIVSGGGNHCPGGAGVHVLQNGSDAGVNYQLTRDGSVTGSPVAGTGAFLDFGAYAPVGTYRVIATSTVTGCSNNMDDSAVVGLYTLPTVYTVTGSNGYCPGGPGAPVMLIHSDSGINYQLYKGAVAIGSPKPGINDSLNFGLQTAGVYTVVAIDPVTNCTNNMYLNATITVSALPASYLVTGGGMFCPGGTGVHVGLSGSQSGVTYQLKNGIASVGTPLSGTGALLDFGLETGTGTYTVIANNTGCSKNMSGSASVANYPAPTPYIVMGSGNYCTGISGLPVSLAGSEVGFTYQLYKNSSALGSPINGTGTTLDFGIHDAGTYTIVATSTGTLCTGNMSGSAVITMNVLPTVYTVLGSGTSYCAGGAGVDVYLNGTSVGVNYQLYQGAMALGAPLAGSGAPLDFGNQTVADVYTIVAIGATSGCRINMFGSVSVSINPLPDLFNVIGGGSYCDGGTGVHIGLTGSTSTIQYQLYNGGVAVGSPVSGTGGLMDLGAFTIPGSYTVMATNTVTACSAIMSGSAGVATLPLPNAFTVTGGGGYCSGGTGVAVNLSGSDVTFTYQLLNGSMPVGLPVPGTTSALGFGLQTTPGVYKVMATNTATGCTNMMASNAPVMINPLPVVHTITGGGNYCPGGSGVNIGLSGSNAGISYRLHYAGSPIGAAMAGNGSALSFGLHTTVGAYTIVATDTATGCVNNMSGTASVGLNALPIVYNVTGGGNYCTGGPGVHIGLSGSEAGIHYQLRNGSGPIGSVITGTGSPVDFGAFTGADVYTAEATNVVTTCMNNMSGSAAIAIATPVTPSVTISSGGGDSLCSGTAATFTAIPTNGGTSPTYHWSVNGATAGSTGNTFSYVPSNGDNVSVTLTSSASCATSATAHGSSTLTVYPTSMPVVNVLASPSNVVCKGTWVNYSAVPVYGGPSPTYTWVMNSTYVGTDSTYTYLPGNGDVVYCILGSNYHCRTQNRVSSPYITMIVDDAVLPVVTITGNPGTYITEGQTLTLTATVENGGPAPAYQWYVNGDPVYGAIFPDFTRSNYSDMDVVKCEVTSNGVCAGLVGFNTVTIHIGNVGVKQIASSAGDVKLVPNPNKGIFTLKGTLGTTGDETISIEITNMLGQAIYTDKVAVHNGIINERIQLSNTLANGMYILNLHSESDNKVFHLIIEQ